MKRQRNLAISFAIVALGIASGYWVSKAYGNPDTELLSDGNSAWQLVRQVSHGGSSVAMPFFDYRKGP